MDDKEYTLFFYSQQQMNSDRGSSNPHVNGMPYTECMSVSSNDGEWNHKKRFPDSRLIFVGSYEDVYWP